MIIPFNTDVEVIIIPQVREMWSVCTCVLCAFICSGMVSTLEHPIRFQTFHDLALVEHEHNLLLENVRCPVMKQLF